LAEVHPNPKFKPRLIFDLSAHPPSPKGGFGGQEQGEL
jgi:hypothetical protein